MPFLLDIRAETNVGLDAGCFLCRIPPSPCFSKLESTHPETVPQSDLVAFASVLSTSHSRSVCFDRAL